MSNYDVINLHLISIKKLKIKQKLHLKQKLWINFVKNLKYELLYNGLRKTIR